MLRIPADPQKLLKVSLLAFLAWCAPMAALLLLETFHWADALFSSALATYAYLTIHGLLTAVAIALGVLVLVRGPSKHRLFVIVPVGILILYAGVLIGGPG